MRDCARISAGCEVTGGPMDNGTQKKVLGLICASVLVIILTAGLWPFHAPKNEVGWISNGNGLHFGNHGAVLSSDAFSLAGFEA